MVLYVFPRGDSRELGEIHTSLSGSGDGTHCREAMVGKETERAEAEEEKKEEGEEKKCKRVLYILLFG